MVLTYWCEAVSQYVLPSHIGKLIEEKSVFLTSMNDDDILSNDIPLNANPSMMPRMTARAQVKVQEEIQHILGNQQYFESV